MRILVSGANGFLGRQVVSRLLEKGYTVRVLIRQGANLRLSEQAGVEIFYGSICNEEDVIKSVQGCDYVIHMAADTNQSYLRPEDYFEPNVKATQYFLDATQKEGCKRFIFVSTANTIAYGSVNLPGVEANKPSDLFMKSGYARSKLLAEEYLLHSTYKKVIILNPTFIIGPEDYHPRSGRIFNLVLNKKIIFCPPGGKNFVDVRDVAKAVVASLHFGRDGERYLISGKNLKFRDFFRKVLKANDQRAIIIHIPAFILRLGGLIGSSLRALGWKMELSRTNVRILCINNFYSNHKAQKDLGVNFRPISKTIRDTLEWKNQP